jgi:nitrate reductase assembly molybdenum cofactor insertion protein NarJ
MNSDHNIGPLRLLATTDSESATQTLKSSGGEKDKYKALARRLKEERNQYRETCEEKQ